MNLERQLNLHLIPGISGSGKTTTARFAARHMTNNGLNASAVVGHTTRRQREEEVHGIDYFFHDHKTFDIAEVEGSPDWRISKIDGHYYFNSDTATLPNHTTPLKILPISYAVLPDIISDYSENSDISISVIPIVIRGIVRARWLKSVQPLRPTRNLCLELEEQDGYISRFHHTFDDIYYPEWDSAESDTLAYTDLLLKVLGMRSYK